MALKIAAAVSTAILLATACQTTSTTADTQSSPSGVVETAIENEVLQQEIIVNASPSDVWNAFTTSEGYMAWASPFAPYRFRDRRLHRKQL